MDHWTLVLTRDAPRAGALLRSLHSRLRRPKRGAAEAPPQLDLVVCELQSSWLGRLLLSNAAHCLCRRLVVERGMMPLQLSVRSRHPTSCRPRSQLTNPSTPSLSSLVRAVTSVDAARALPALLKAFPGALVG